jgi:hypothetical protein
MSPNHYTLIPRPSSSRLRRTKRATIVAIGMLSLWLPVAHGHGAPDESHWPATRPGGQGCGGSVYTRQGQSFVMKSDTLVAIDLFLGVHVGILPPGGVAVTVTLRDTDVWGSALASESMHLERDGPYLRHLHVDFQAPITNVAGSRLYIEFMHPGLPRPVITWQRTLYDRYPGGEGRTCYGDVNGPGRFSDNLPSPDFLFRAYAPAIVSPEICPHIYGRVPDTAIAVAYANPHLLRGYGQPRNAALAPGRFNPMRRWITLERLSVPFHPVFNPLVLRADCP